MPGLTLVSAAAVVATGPPVARHATRATAQTIDSSKRDMPASEATGAARATTGRRERTGCGVRQCPSVPCKPPENDSVLANAPFGSIGASCANSESPSSPASFGSSIE